MKNFLNPNQCRYLASLICVLGAIFAFISKIKFGMNSIHPTFIIGILIIIAGPTGGTDEKPVGLVYVGICANCSKFPIKLLLGETNGSKNSRNYIRKLACNAVLYTIWKLT